MSDEKNVFDFHGLSDDEELDKLLESVRRDIGEASPQSARPARPSRPAPQPSQPYQPSQPARESAEPEEARRQAAPAAQQIRQPRPAAARVKEAGREAPEPESRAGRTERELPPQRERIRVVHPEDEEPERPRRSRFGLAFGIYTAVLFLILAAGCVLLWFYLDAYESTRPEKTMDEFTELADEAYWSDAVKGAFTVSETPFENRDELMEELCMSVIRSYPLVYREDGSWTEDNMSYMVSAGGKNICRVTIDEVAENGNAGFGFTYLEVTRVELLASFTAPMSHDVTITAPADAAVTVNGIELTEEYVNAEDASLPASVTDGLGELETEIAGQLYTVYTISGLYAPVEVCCTDAEGNVLAPADEPEDDSAVFALGEGTLDYRILVPEGSSISVNGVELDESYNTGDTVVPAFLQGFDDYGTLPELELWLVEGLHAEPEISVESGRDSLEGVTAGDELVFFPEGDETLPGTHTDEVTEFMTAYVNYLTGEAASEEDYTALQGKVLDGSALDTALEELKDGYEANGLAAERVRVRSDSFQSIGSTCFTCTVNVEYSPAEEDGEDINVSYAVVFVMSGGVWQAAAAVC